MFVCLQLKALLSSAEVLPAALPHGPIALSTAYYAAAIGAVVGPDGPPFARFPWCDWVLRGRRQYSRVREPAAVWPDFVV